MVELEGTETPHGRVYKYALSQSYDGTFAGYVRLDLRESADSDDLDTLRRFIVGYEIETGPDGGHVEFEYDDAEYKAPDTEDHVRVSVNPEGGEYPRIGELVQQTAGDIKRRANY